MFGKTNGARMMAHRASTEDLEFVKDFESFGIAAGEFDHGSHVRMAYTYLCENDARTTCTKVRHVLHSFLSHAGIEPSTKYHETLTQAWVFAVRHFMKGLFKKGL